MSRLTTELTRLLNQHSAENDSNTADFILAEYLIGCLNAFNAAVVQRDEWYGMRPEPGVGGDSRTGRFSSGPGPDGNQQPNVEEIEKRKIIITGMMTEIPSEEFIAQIEKDYSTKPAGVYRSSDSPNIIIGVGLPDEPNVWGIPQQLFDEAMKDAFIIDLDLDLGFGKGPEPKLDGRHGFDRDPSPGISDLIDALRRNRRIGGFPVRPHRHGNRGK